MLADLLTFLPRAIAARRAAREAAEAADDAAFRARLAAVLAPHLDDAERHRLNAVISGSAG